MGNRSLSTSIPRLLVLAGLLAASGCAGDDSGGAASPTNTTPSSASDDTSVSATTDAASDPTPTESGPTPVTTLPAEQISYIRIDPETGELTEVTAPERGPTTLTEVVDLGITAGLWDELDGLERVLGYVVGAVQPDQVPGVGEIESSDLGGLLDHANELAVGGEYGEDDLAELRRLYELIAPPPEALDLLAESAQPSEAQGFRRRAVPSGCAPVDPDDFSDWAVVEGCYKVIEATVTTPYGDKRMRVYYPAWYDETDEALLPQAALEALIESTTVYSSYALVGDISMVFSLVDTIDSDATLAVATVDSQWGLASIAGACPVTMFPSAAADIRALQQTVAHEVWHCVQRENGYRVGVPEGYAWYIEGGAEYMSNVVYPDVNDEHGWAGVFDWNALRTPVFDLSYDAWVWWQYLGSEQGPAAVVDLMQRIEDSGDRGVGIMTDSYGPSFQSFVVDYMAGVIPDGGGKVPRGELTLPPPLQVDRNSDGKTLDVEVEPFVAGRWTIEYDKQLRVLQVDRTETPGGLAMVEKDRRTDPAEWKEVFPEVRSKCETKAYYMIAATTDQGTHRPRIEITETEQAVCDPCLIGTWDLRLDTFKELIVAASGGAVPAGVDFEFGGNYFLEFEDDGDFKDQRAGLSINATAEGQTITFVIDSYAEGRYTADGENIAILDVVELYVNVAAPIPGAGFSDTNVFDPGGGGTYVCDDDVLTVTVESYPPISWDRVDKILKPDNTVPT